MVRDLQKELQKKKREANSVLRSAINPQMVRCFPLIRWPKWIDTSAKSG